MSAEDALEGFSGLFKVDFTPSNYRSVNPFELVTTAIPGDHVVVHSSTDGQRNVYSHHGIFIGGNKVAHMHPDGNICTLSIGEFLGSPRDILNTGIVDYTSNGVGPFPNEFTLAMVRFALEDPRMQTVKYDGFATWCKTGRYDKHYLVLDILECAPMETNKKNVRRRKPLSLFGMQVEI